MGARVGRRLYYGFLARNCLNTPDPETQLTESYPAQLSVLLGGDEWDVRNFGKGGRTVVDIEGRAYRDASAYEEALTWGDDGFEVLIIGVPGDVRDLSVSRDAGPWHEHSAVH